LFAVQTGPAFGLVFQFKGREAMGRLTNLKPRLGMQTQRLERVGQEGITRSVERNEAQPWRAWYNTARWRALRQKVLLRDGYMCRKTGVMLVGKYPSPISPVVDHIKPHRGDEHLFWDIENLQAVSKEYHDSTKQRIEKGGRVKL